MLNKSQLRTKYLKIRQKKYFEIKEKFFNPIFSLIKKIYKNKKIYMSAYYPSSYELNTIPLFQTINKSKLIILLYYKNLSLKLLFLLSLLSFTINGYAQNDSSNTSSIINGSIILDSTWSPKIYLSHIPSFNKMHTMSKSMIIAETIIDGSGHFEFDTDYLPKEDNLYRIHISKKKSSPASLIIGGNNENHFFIIANSIEIYLN